MAPMEWSISLFLMFKCPIQEVQKDAMGSILKGQEPPTKTNRWKAFLPKKLCNNSWWPRHRGWWWHCLWTYSFHISFVIKLEFEAVYETYSSSLTHTGGLERGISTEDTTRIKRPEAFIWMDFEFFRYQDRIFLLRILEIALEQLRRSQNDIFLNNKPNILTGINI